MKINKIYALWALLLSALALASCSDSDDYSGPGEWNANADYTRVAFVKDADNVELDPADATTLPISLVRTTAGEELKVPITVEENDSNVFTLTEAKFAAGDTTATFYVNFPSAEVGKAYKLKLLINDPSVSSFYSSNNSYELIVTRVKWNLLGMGTFEENFVYEGTSKVEIYQKDGDCNTYRVMRPFDKIVYSDGTTNEGELDGNQSEYTVLTISEADKPFATEEKASKSGLVHFTTMNSGYLHPTYGADIKLYHPSSFKSMQDEEMWEFSKVLAYQDDEKTPGQIQLAPYVYMDDVGGWDQTQENGMVLITFPGYTPVEIYEAKVPDDFTWANVFDGSFDSEKLGSSTTKTLQVGTCTAKKDNADSAFAASYGTAYRIKSAYAEGADLYFCVKQNGTFTVPSGFEAQNTCLTAVGDSVYAKINVGDCEYSANVVTLSVTFQNADGTIVYGTTTETMSNITWTAIGTGNFVYGSGIFDEEEGQTTHATDVGLTLSKRDDKDNVYKISDWGVGVDFTFTWNKETNEVTVPAQPIGITHPKYGAAYVSDMFYYGDYSYDEYPCYYDAEAKTFHFFNVYYVSEGYLAYGDETFEVSFATADAKARSHKAGATVSGKLKAKKGQYRQKNLWKGRRVRQQASRKATKPSTQFSAVKMETRQSLFR